jgi:glycosyltransferase involved in cell wall biosynthesis
VKILIVCEHFSPQTGARALQATKVANALHSEGCEIYVLCGEPQGSPSPQSFKVEWVASQSNTKPTSVVDRILRRLRYEWSAVNPRGEWVRAMAVRTVEICNAFEPDIILTQSTPFRAHLVGLHLPESLRRRWVAYFSDLWPLSLVPYPYRTRIANLLRPIQMAKLIEVLSAARCSIFTNEVSVRRLMQAWPDGDKGRCHVVAHIGTPQPNRDTNTVLISRYGGRFVHIGKLTRERSCPQLVEAIGQWTDSDDVGRIRFPGFTFVGEVDPVFRRSCVDLERTGLVEFLGEVDATVAQEISRAAGTLVVIEAEMDESPFLASKFADYAMLGKPILAIGPQGPIRDLLTDCGGGIAVGHDVAAIRTAMEALAAPDRFRYDSATLAAHFSPARVARRYLGIFREII